MFERLFDSFLEEFQVMSLARSLKAYVKINPQIQTAVFQKYIT